MQIVSAGGSESKESNLIGFEKRVLWLDRETFVKQNHKTLPSLPCVYRGLSVSKCFPGVIKVKCENTINQNI